MQEMKMQHKITKVEMQFMKAQNCKGWKMQENDMSKNLQEL